MIDILENKQYITDINSKWTFFKFPNGKEDRVATNIKLKDVLLDYFRNEYRFYKRMYEELNDISDKKRKEVDKLPRHTEEEITHATLFEDMNMRTDNEKFKEKSYEVHGINSVTNNAFHMMMFYRGKVTRLLEMTIWR